MRKYRFLWWLLPFFLLAVVAVFTIYLGHGQLIIATDVPGAQLLIFDAKKQKIKADFSRRKDNTFRALLRPGHYTLKISHPQYVYYYEPFNIWARRQVKIKISLKKVPEVNLLAKTISNKNLDFWFPEKGIVYQDAEQQMLVNSFENKKSDLTPANFGDVDEIFWQPQKHLALLRKASGEVGLYDFARYDLVHQEYHSWSVHIRTAAWRPDGERVIYVWQTKDENSLVKVNKDGSGFERLLDLAAAGLGTPKILWSPNEERVLLIENGIWKFNLITKELKKIRDEAVEGAIFSPAGERLLFNAGEELRVSDQDGQNAVSLGKMELERVGFLGEEEIIYFAEENNELPLFGLNLATGEKKYFIYASKEKIEPEKVLVDEKSRKIYFLSDQKLFSLDLVEARY